jgi:hypothetical protein
MRRARHATVSSLLLLATLLAMPGVALAADPVTVSGTVVRDGAPVTGVSVTVTVVGSDVIAAAVTDENGAFAVDVEAAVGDVVQVSATGQTFTSPPDANGCVRTETPTGRASLALEQLPPAPIEVALDQLVTSEACGATHTPLLTPPATDAGAGTRPTSGAGGGLLLVLGVLAFAGAGSLAVARRRA